MTTLTLEEFDPKAIDLGTARAHAAHESGHAVVAAWIGWRVTSLEISDAAGSGRGGICRWQGALNGSLRGNLIAYGAMLFAGEEAHFALTGDRGAAFRGGGHDRSTFNAECSKLRMRCALVRPFTVEDEEDATRVAKLIASSIVSTCWPTIGALSRRLLGDGKIGEASVHRIIERRPLPAGLLESIRALMA